MKNIITGILSLVSLTVWCQDPLVIDRIELPIEIDGRPFEKAWSLVKPLPPTMYTPSFAGAMTEKTEFRIAYDDNYLYASGRFYDSEPESIRGNSMIRDVDKGGDFFNFLIDTYDDNQTVVGFSLNPSGNKMDTEINNDAEGDFALFYNINWNSFWEGKVTKDEKGWYGEFRIPFTSLKFEEKDGEVRFGIILHRLIGRKNERHVFPAIRPDWAAGAWKASQAQTIILKGLTRVNPIYFTPYALGGYQLKYDAYPNQNTRNERFKYEAGADLKWGISNNITLDATLNTDFAQIEADDQQVNLSRFSLFFPEKRQFFQERSGTFNFSMMGNDRLFHSRVIGISPAGNPLRMYGGLRLTARANGWDLGLLNTQIAGSDSLPSENFGILRVRKRIVNKNSFAGGIFTSRLDEKGQTQITYGVDATLNLYNSNFLTIKAGESVQTGSRNSFGNQSFAYLLAENRNSNGPGYQVEVAYYGQEFNPSVGFIARKGVFISKLLLQYGYFLPSSKIRSITPFFVQTSYHNAKTEALESSATSLGVAFTARTGAQAEIFAYYNYDSFESSFSLSDEISIVPGDYKFLSIVGKYKMNEGRPLRFNFDGEVGDYYQGKRYSFVFSPTWTVNKYLDLGVDAIYNLVEFSGPDFKGNIYRFRSTLALNTHISFNGFVQWNESQDLIGMNLKLRYNWKDGQDLFLVYNENVHQNDPEVPRVENRAILLKYVYTFSKR